MMGALFNKLVGSGTKKLRTYAGDNGFLKAATAVAANVIAADGKVDDAEIKKGKRVMGENPIIKASFGESDIMRELDSALDRAETRSGRNENAKLISAMAERDLEDRQSLFLIGVDVADVGEIGDAERATLEKLAGLLKVDMEALLAA